MPGRRRSRPAPSASAWPDPVLRPGSSDRLALRLAHPLPHPVDALPLWPGITAVPPNHTAVLAPGRPARTFAHWHPPAAERARPEALSALADPRPYPAWLALAADRLTRPDPPSTTRLLGWGVEPRLPPWATPRAAELVRDQLRAVRGEAAQPLAPEHAQHQVLSMVRHSAAAMRQLIDITARAGVPYSVPFLDDRVLDACLAAETTTRGTPFEYKPLLTAAVAPDVPADLLRRTGKGDFSVDTHQGLARHRPDLAALVEDSALARAGLVDPDALRRACLGLYPTGTSYAALDATLACEHWLRAHGTSPHPASPTTAEGA